MDESPAEVNQGGFSLTRGGPFERLMRRVGLGQAGWRAVVLALVAWLPLVLIAVARGLLLEDPARFALLYEVELHIRFLLALPLLVIAAFIVDLRVGEVVRHLPSSGLLDETEMPALRRALDGTERLARSSLAEIVLAGLAYLTVFTGSHAPGDLSAGLFLRAAPGEQVLSSAGWWYSLLSQPLYVFLLYRWIWRWLAWVVFLWRFSRLPLRLSAAHPDRAGGLMFLSDAATAFWLFIFAASLSIAAGWLAAIYDQRATLSVFFAPLLALLALVLLVFLGPLLLFGKRLIDYKRQGSLKYSALLDRYTHHFDRKWVYSPERMPARELLGSADFSALADLGTSFGFVQRMRFVPISKEAVLLLALAVLLPMLPLVFTEIPLRELAQVIFKHLL